MITGYPMASRSLALTLLALLAVAAWIGPVGAYIDLVAAGGRQLGQRAQTLQRYRAVAREPANAAARVETARSHLLLPAMPEAQAVALLQQNVKSAAAAARVEVRSLQVLRSVDSGDAERIGVRIGVRIAATGDVGGLARLLFAIETARPVLYPDNLQVQARPAVAGKQEDPLDFELDVSGFASQSVQ